MYNGLHFEKFIINYLIWVKYFFNDKLIIFHLIFYL
jgi:hypothetical protein